MPLRPRVQVLIGNGLLLGGGLELAWLQLLWLLQLDGRIFKSTASLFPDGQFMKDSGL